MDNAQKIKDKELVSPETIFNEVKKSIEKKEGNNFLKPITKKQFALKLVPFILFDLFIIGLSLVFAIVPSFVSLPSNTKTAMYAFIPILIVLAGPFGFYFFDKAYCQYNLKHNEKMKTKFCYKFVKSFSKNGCFPIREWYLTNPNQLAWKTNGEDIIDKFKRFKPKEFEKTIEYYRELQFGDK